MMHVGVKTVMGGSGLLRFKPCPDLPQLLSVLASHRVTTIDTAVSYADSEENLGAHKAGERFTLDTKVPGGMAPDSLSKDDVQRLGRESLRKLNVDQVDILYIHSPVPESRLPDYLDSVNQLYGVGMFRRLGLSNFKPEQVQEVYDICRSRGYVLPTVYQGNYNAFARSYEQTLLPLLRKLDMSFYAYSPQAGGFLSKTADLVTQTKGDGEGRFLGRERASDMYQALYKKPTLLEGLITWNKIAQDAELKPGDMAIRWVKYNSALQPDLEDAIIIGGRTVEQVSEALEALEQGPLSEEVVKRIDEVWETVRDEAPVDNYHDWIVNAQKD